MQLQAPHAETKFCTQREDRGHFLDDRTAEQCGTCLLRKSAPAKWNPVGQFPSW